VLLERHSVGGIEIPEHEHSELCLHLQVRGQEDFEWWSEGGNRIERTRSGSMILLAPGTRDRLHWHGNSERLILSMKPELLQRTALELGTNGDVSFRNRWALDDPATANLVTEMGKQAEDDWPLGKLYADLVGMSLASTLLRRFAETPPPAITRKGQLPMPQLRRAMEFITANLHRDVNLEEISAEIGLSPFHFARMFRETSGQTPYQYLLDQRISLAKSLLRNGTFSVQDIALQTGFSSPTNFVRAFRQRVGVTPGGWSKG
jgi:AraC family transcriptional regulator